MIRTIERISDSLSIIEGAAQSIYDEMIDISEELVNLAKETPGRAMENAAFCDPVAPEEGQRSPASDSWREGFAAGFREGFFLSRSVNSGKNGTESVSRGCSNAAQ